MKFVEIKGGYKKFMTDWEKGEEHRFRSYDFCKNLFDEHYARILKGETLTYREKENFALNLYCYLASWGMVCRGSLLLNRSYRFLIPMCDVLFNSDYQSLWNIDPLSKDYDCELVNELYKALVGNVGETNNGKDLKEKEATRLLICKIIMGTYGCVIAYDTYDQNTLRALGIRISSDMITLLQSTYDIIDSHKDEFKMIMNDMKKHIDSDTKKPVNYTAFKVLDMILWIEGEKIEKKKNKKKKEQKRAQKEAREE